MGTCYSVDEAVVDLPSGSPVKCDTSAETTSVKTDKDGKDSITNQRGPDVGLLVKNCLPRRLPQTRQSSSQRAPALAVQVAEAADEGAGPAWIRSPRRSLALKASTSASVNF